MESESYSKRIAEIVERLSRLAEEDRRAIPTESPRNQVVLDIKQLLAWGERYEERKRLHKKLTALAAERME